MTPRSSGPGGEYPPLRGTTNLRLTANQHCNVTENCAGVLAGATSPTNRIAAQLQTAWVTFGKQTLSTSRKRRSPASEYSAARSHRSCDIMSYLTTSLKTLTPAGRQTEPAGDGCDF